MASMNCLSPACVAIKQLVDDLKMSREYDFSTEVFDDQASGGIHVRVGRFHIATLELPAVPALPLTPETARQIANWLASQAH